MTAAVVTRTGQGSAFSLAGMVTALESAWSAIRAVHVEVPGVVMVVASGTSTKPAEAPKLGHFAAMRWQHGPDRMPEVLVSGEGLSRPSDVFTTLLHEAVHAVSNARGVQDTSRQGRWHNKRFATVAGELGLDAVKDDKHGWSSCTMRPSTQDKYRAVIAELGAAMVAYRHPDTVAEKKRVNSNNGVSLSCDCPRKIRVSVTVAELGPILCGVCDSPFLSDEQREEEQTVAAHAYDPTGQHHGGMPTFPYRLAPEGLATRRQLRAQGLRPGGQGIAGQILWRKGKRVAYLYRVELALPKRAATPAQLAALDKAMVARRTCSTCTQVKDYYIPLRFGECLDCHQGALVGAA